MMITILRARGMPATRVCRAIGGDFFPCAAASVALSSSVRAVSLLFWLAPSVHCRASVPGKEGGGSNQGIIYDRAEKLGGNRSMPLIWGTTGISALQPASVQHDRSRVGPLIQQADGADLVALLSLEERHRWRKARRALPWDRIAYALEQTFDLDERRLDGTRSCRVRAQSVSST